MADETLYGTRGFLKLVQGGGANIRNEDYEWHTINSSAAVIGNIVTRSGETAPAVGLCKTGDTPYGIIDSVDPALSNSSYTSIDSTIPSGTKVKILKFRNRAIGSTIPMFLEAAAGPIAVSKDDLIALGTEDGKIRKWSYTDAAASTDTLSEVIGKAVEANAGSATDDHILLVMI